MREAPVPIERVRAALAYDPGTGILSWKDGRGLVDRVDPSNGYVRFVLDGIHLYAHNIIWFMMTGEYPSKKEVDHADLDRSDNRWDNLRKSNPSLQQANRGLQRNNKLKVKGVSYCQSTGKYRADIRVAGKQINLGRRASIDEAQALYAAAASKYYGEFARTE